MTTQEAITMLRTDPVAQALLRSTIPARLAYLARDAPPRVVPMWFEWTGEEIIMGAPPNSPKVRALADHPDVVVSIDSNEWPYGLLSLRGTAAGTVLGEIFPEYAAMARRYLGEEGAQQFLAQARQTFSRWTRIAIRPVEVRILDFQARFPSAWSAGQ